MKKFDIVIIGAGPAGLAAAKRATDCKAKVLLIEREAKLGGILKQCIHDGFGLTRFKEKLSGPEYAFREIASLRATDVEISTLTYVEGIVKEDGGFLLTLITREGISKVWTSKIILATGCRERTARQIAIQGSNPAGVFTAGAAQYYINVLGKMPTRRCIILGSGDIGLIMARRITLEGGSVEGVYEVKQTPSGLTRNLAQCLDDFDIPLHLSHTVTRVFGDERLTGVEIASVDDKMHPIAGTERIVACDALIISVGLIPENEIAEKLGVSINPRTRGPYVDQTLMTMVDGVYSCGNALHVSDSADYVSESGETAGRDAASKKEEATRHLIPVKIDARIGYVVPSHIDANSNLSDVIFYFRAASELENVNLLIEVDGKVVLKRKYQRLRPPEMERIAIELGDVSKIAAIGLHLEDSV